MEQSLTVPARQKHSFEPPFVITIETFHCLPYYKMRSYCDQIFFAKQFVLLWLYEQLAPCVRASFHLLIETDGILHS